MEQEKRKLQVLGFTSNQTVTFTLVGKSAFELVHLCKDLLFVFDVQMAKFRNVFETFLMTRFVFVR